MFRIQSPGHDHLFRVSAKGRALHQVLVQHDGDDDEGIVIGKFGCEPPVRVPDVDAATDCTELANAVHLKGHTWRAINYVITYSQPAVKFIT